MPLGELNCVCATSTSLYQRVDPLCTAPVHRCVGNTLPSTQGVTSLHSQALTVSMQQPAGWIVGHHAAFLLLRSLHTSAWPGAGMRSVRCWDAQCQSQVLGCAVSVSGAGMRSVRVRCWDAQCQSQVLGCAVSESGAGMRSVRCWDAQCQVLGCAVSELGAGMRSVRVRCWDAQCTQIFFVHRAHHRSLPLHARVQQESEGMTNCEEVWRRTAEGDAYHWQEVGAWRVDHATKRAPHTRPHTPGDGISCHRCAQDAKRLRPRIFPRRITDACHPAARY
eukprot:356121-Chlamydomonas_euryale.AAC.3